MNSRVNRRTSSTGLRYCAVGILAITVLLLGSLLTHAHAAQTPNAIGAVQQGSDVVLSWESSPANSHVDIYLDGEPFPFASVDPFTDYVDVNPPEGSRRYFLAGCNEFGVCSQPSPIVELVVVGAGQPVQAMQCSIPISNTIPNQVQNVLLEPLAEQGQAVLTWDVLVGVNGFNAGGYNVHIDNEYIGTVDGGDSFTTLINYTPGEVVQVDAFDRDGTNALGFRTTEFAPKSEPATIVGSDGGVEPATAPVAVDNSAELAEALAAVEVLTEELAAETAENLLLADMIASLTDLLDASETDEQVIALTAQVETLEATIRARDLALADSLEMLTGATTDRDTALGMVASLETDLAACQAEIPTELATGSE